MGTTKIGTKRLSHGIRQAGIERLLISSSVSYSLLKKRGHCVKTLGFKQIRKILVVA